MGIKPQVLRLIKESGAKTVLSLSYPDLVMPVHEAEEIIGAKLERSTGFNTWHHVEYPLPETLEVFNKMGMELHTVDIVASRGVERVVDLNYPCDLGQYELVIDPGTTEHCFSIGQAILNASRAVKVGGSIIHTPPMSMINHGFYNLNPTLFYDFYTQNGWSLDLMVGTLYKDNFKTHHFGRYAVPSETSLLVVATRTTDKEPSFPIQHKYLKNPDLK